MRLDNLARLCSWHHYLKTHRGYRLSGGPGSWRFEGPDSEPSQTGKLPGTITAFDGARGP